MPRLGSNRPRWTSCDDLAALDRGQRPREVRFNLHFLAYGDRAAPPPSSYRNRLREVGRELEDDVHRYEHGEFKLANFVARRADA